MSVMVRKRRQYLTCPKRRRAECLLRTTSIRYIVSLTQTELKDIASLLTKKGRKLKRQFLAEGVRLLEEATRHDRRPLAVYWSGSMLSERGQSLVERLRGQRI